jgi:hypothetical protein
VVTNGRFVIGKVTCDLAEVPARRLVRFFFLPTDVDVSISERQTGGVRESEYPLESRSWQAVGEGNDGLKAELEKHRWQCVLWKMPFDTGKDGVDQSGVDTYAYNIE